MKKKTFLINKMLKIYKLIKKLVARSRLVVAKIKVILRYLK